MTKQVETLSEFIERKAAETEAECRAIVLRDDGIENEFRRLVQSNLAETDSDSKGEPYYDTKDMEGYWAEASAVGEEV